VRLSRLALPSRFPIGLVRLLVLCLFIVAMGMIRPRLDRGDAGWVLLVCGLVTLAALLAFAGATWRVAGHLPVMSTSWRLVDAVRLLFRRTGLPLLGLAFFLFWTFVYLGLWWYHPEETFTGLSERPRFADFFYYAVTAALTSPPEDIVAASRGARSATMIEMLTGIALLGAYLSSFVQLRRDARPEEEARPPDAAP
jgi:hypothetical protein